VTAIYIPAWKSGIQGFSDSQQATGHRDQGFRDKKIDEVTHQARLKERRNYAILGKARPDAGGHVRLRCPASNPNPVGRCEVKPRSDRPSTRGRLRIPALRVHPPAICSNESIKSCSVGPDRILGTPTFAPTLALGRTKDRRRVGLWALVWERFRTRQ